MKHKNSYDNNEYTFINNLFKEENLLSPGIINSSSNIEQEKFYNSWLKNKYSAKMDYLEKQKHLKFNPAGILSGCKSLIITGLNYFQSVPDTLEKNFGRISIYAMGRDYHKVLGKKLKRITQHLNNKYPDEEFRSFTDISPLKEIFYAEKAGLGFTGKNGLLINSIHGSWIVIGEILSTKHFKSHTNKIKKKCPDNCFRCINACPTGALLRPNLLNAGKCISYLTIENKGIIPENIRSKLKNNIFGCDICMKVCPFNYKKPETTEPDFIKEIAGPALDLISILQIKNHDEFVEYFGGSPVIRAKRQGLIRNACICGVNNNYKAIIPNLKKLINDENPVIAEHAIWALKQMTN